MKYVFETKTAPQQMANPEQSPGNDFAHWVTRGVHPYIEFKGVKLQPLPEYVTQISLENTLLAEENSLLKDFVLDIRQALCKDESVPLAQLAANIRSIASIIDGGIQRGDRVALEHALFGNNQQPIRSFTDLMRRAAWLNGQYLELHRLRTSCHDFGIEMQDRGVFTLQAEE